MKKSPSYQVNINALYIGELIRLLLTERVKELEYVKVIEDGFLRSAELIGKIQNHHLEQAGFNANYSAAVLEERIQGMKHGSHVFSEGEMGLMARALRWMFAIKNRDPLELFQKVSDHPADEIPLDELIDVALRHRAEQAKSRELIEGLIDDIKIRQ